MLPARACSALPSSRSSAVASRAGSVELAATHTRCCRRAGPLAALCDGGASFESEESLDSGLAEELGKIVNPARGAQMASKLDMLWKIGKVRSDANKPEACSCCQGTGEIECEWCHGTGVLMVGDTLICSITDHTSKCPVCNSTGYAKCKNCAATGFRAKWLAGTGATPKGGKP
ncbi:hypothetical protein FOA52_011027 [Chlamydomonas sp. UWO 241]|nr:hypothetical protein FOA52_011027 [Chlamydomonas sp. UWO 241]